MYLMRNLLVFGLLISLFDFHHAAHAERSLKSFRLKCSTEKHVVFMPGYEETASSEVFAVDVDLAVDDAASNQLQGDARVVLLDHGITDVIRAEDGPAAEHHNWYLGEYDENQIKTGQAFHFSFDDDSGYVIREFKVDRNTGEYQFTNMYKEFSKPIKSFFTTGVCELGQKAF